MKYHEMERPEAVLVAPSGPNHRPPVQEVTTMADASQYRDSARARNANKTRTEIWKPVPSEPGVLVSSWGRFLLPPRYAPMSNGGFRAYMPKPRYGQVSREKPTALHSYRIAMVYRAGEGPRRQRTRKVHQLVCEAFHGPKPFSDAVVIHINDDAHDNRPGNLRWGTQRENLNMPVFREYRETGVHPIHSNTRRRASNARP